MPEEPVLFGGVPKIPPPEAFAQARRNNPRWYQILEQAYAQFVQRPENRGAYADPKGSGATLDQVWLSFTLFGVSPVCLLAKPCPEEQRRRIPTLVDLDAADLVQVLKDMQAVEGNLNATTLHYDGQTGHCIRLTSYEAETDRFEYHEPWPDGSLLSEENNIAGVKAKPEGHRWSVSAEELERVIYATFVFRPSWVRREGLDVDIHFETVREGEFFEFFRLEQLDEHVEGDHRIRTLAPGAFTKEIRLVFDCASRGEIRRAVLLMDKKWMMSSMPLALDLTKSFVATFAPPAEPEPFQDISQAIWSLRHPASAVALRAADPAEDVTVRCVHAFAGGVQVAEMNTDFGSLRIRNEDSAQGHALEIEYHLL